MISPSSPVTARSLWAQPNFLLAWWARLCGTAAQQMLMVAVGWQMYDLTGSAWDLGLVGLYEFAPSLALVLISGHAADRYPRHKIIAACLALQSVIAVTLALGTNGDWISRHWLLTAALGLGVARAFQMPSQQSLVPLLVPSAMLPRGLALASVASQSAIIGGPAIGGLVYAGGATVVYVLCTALFAIGCLLISRLTLQPTADPARGAPSLQTLLAGIRYIAGQPIVLGAISLDLFAVLLGGATALLPIFAKDILHVGPFGLGILRASPAVGALAMSLVLARWPLSRRVGRWLFLSAGIYGVCNLVFAVSTSFALSALVLILSGVADMISVVIRQSLVQLETPDAMRGRVSAVNSIFIGASNQLGEFESGATAAWLGPVGSVLLGGVGTLVIVILWTRLFPALWHRDLMREPSEKSA